MKITQIGKQHRFVGTATNTTALGGITIASNSTLPVIPGYVWTAQSSNTAAWVANVNAITANSSNTLQSPIVNFESGTGVTFGVSSNTITITATATPISDGTYVLANKGGQEVVTSHGTLGATETIDLATEGNSHAGTLDQDCTFTFSGALNGTEVSFTLELTEDGAGGWTPTWPGSVAWPGGTTPTHTTTAGSATIYVFRTRDGGTTWYGFQAGGGGGDHTHSSNTISGAITISNDSTLAITQPAASELHLSAPFYSEVVTEPVRTAMGEVHIADNTTETVITTQSTWTRVRLSGATIGQAQQFDMPNDLQLRYTGAETGVEAVMAATMSIEGVGANDEIKAVLIEDATVNGDSEYATGDILTDGVVKMTLRGANAISSMSIQVLHKMSTNDTIDLFVQNNSDTDNLIVSDANLHAFLPGINPIVEDGTDVVHDLVRLY